MSATDNRVAPWDEIKLIQDSLLKIWAIYMNWFTWFYGAQLLSLAAVANTSCSASTMAGIALARLWMFVSVLGILATLLIGFYSLSVHLRVPKLWLQIPGANKEHAGHLLPTALLIFASVANTLALSAGILVWNSISGTQDCAKKPSLNVPGIFGAIASDHDVLGGMT